MSVNQCQNQSLAAKDGKLHLLLSNLQSLSLFLNQIVMKKGKSKIKSKGQNEVNKYIPSIAIKKIPPDRALAILKKTGYNIDEEQSEEVMEFLYIIVKLTLKEFFTSD